MDSNARHLTKTNGKLVLLKNSNVGISIKNIILESMKKKYMTLTFYSLVTI